MSLRTAGTVDVLLVEDNPGDATLFEQYLDTSGEGVYPPAEITHVETLDAAFATLESKPFDLVVLDLGLPESAGLETLDRYLDRVGNDGALSRIPVVVLTGLADQSTSLAAIERGAQDYLVKADLNASILNRTVRHALERHEQQRQLRRQNARLEKFASVVSHDLRNPLTVAIGRLDHLRGEVDSEHLDVIERSHERMEALIDDLLELAKHGKTVSETRETDLEGLAPAAWGQVETGAATLDCSGDLTVEADPDRCQQLLENLFRNAVEHGGREVTVRLGGMENGFFVADDGSGIPDEDAGKVFDTGFTTNESGTGFGLNIVEEIAEAHGWSVVVTTSEAGGARFEFTTGS
jgi:signal transduction histidine kinase